MLVGLIGSESLRSLEQPNKLINDPYDFSKETVSKLTASSSGIQGESKGYLKATKGKKKKNSKFLESTGGKKVESKGDSRTPKDNTKKESDDSTNICYNLISEQLQAVNDPSKFLIIEGEFGTGKTFVLKERAKKKANKYPNSRIAYINFSSLHNATLHGLTHNGSLSVMDILAINDFKHLNDIIEVVTVKTLYDHIDQDIVKGRNEITVNEPEKQPWIEVSSVLNSFLKHNEYDHIFIDELPTLNEFLEMDEKFNFHNALEKGNSFCMTLKSQEFHENVWLSEDPSNLKEGFK